MNYSVWLRGVVAAFLLIGTSDIPTTAADQPNVVIIFTDDQGY